MKTRLVGLILLVAATVLNAGCAFAVPEAVSRPVRKKLIATGWDSPDPATFRAHLAEFEQFPFDGTVIRPTRVTADGKTLSANMAFNREHWSEVEFQQAMVDLQAATPVTATNNFLLLNANPGDVDWFDDAGWVEIAEHWRLLARLAKQGGLKGIVFDIEPYTSPFQQFNYSTQRGGRRTALTNMPRWRASADVKSCGQWSGNTPISRF
jgi:hypothetical protein